MSERWMCTKPGCWCHSMDAESAYSLRPLSELKKIWPDSPATQEDYEQICAYLHEGTIGATLLGCDMITELFPNNTWEQLEATNGIR